MRAFLPAALVFVVIVVSAPAIGHVRDFIFETFPRGGVRFLSAAFALAAVGFFVYAVARIRSHRALRYGGLVAVGVLLWVQTVGLATDQIQVNAAEKVHVIEYGLLAFLLYRAFIRRAAGAGDLSILLATFLGVAVAGTADEFVQWVAPQRTGDIRDVVLNFTAGLSGLLFALCLDPPRSWSWHVGAAHRRGLTRLAAAAVLAAGLFFHVAHLGYEIADPEVGRFRSRFTAEQLRQLSERRQVEWAARPPTGLDTWGVEDYFLTEAAWHANHRNSSYRNGLHALAWTANRTLEKYYEPFLDVESFRGSGRHRYPENQLREIEAHKDSIDPSTFVSPVLAGRIRPWPKPLFLSALGAVVAVLWTAPRWLRGPMLL